MEVDRDVYRRERNEIERQFAQHNIQKDMAEAARIAPPVLSRRDATRNRTANRLALVALIGIAAALCYVFGVF
jgi:cytochrome c-type biogenesis protein CcmH/NrfG